MHFIKYWWFGIDLEIRYLNIAILNFVLCIPISLIFGAPVGVPLMIFGIGLLIAFGLIHAIIISINKARIEYNAQMAYEQCRILSRLRGINETDPTQEP